MVYFSIIMVVYFSITIYTYIQMVSVTASLRHCVIFRKNGMHTEIKEKNS